MGRCRIKPVILLFIKDVEMVATFENVDLGGKSIEASVRAYRRQLGEQLKAMIQDGEISKELSVEKLVEYLRT